MMLVKERYSAWCLDYAWTASMRDKSWLTVEMHYHEILGGLDDAILSGSNRTAIHRTRGPMRKVKCVRVDQERDRYARVIDIITYPRRWGIWFMRTAFYIFTFLFAMPLCSMLPASWPWFAVSFYWSTVCIIHFHVTDKRRKKLELP